MELRFLAGEAWSELSIYSNYWKEIKISSVFLHLCAPSTPPNLVVVHSQVLSVVAYAEAAVAFHHRC
jgi:hypothetical protein